MVLHIPHASTAVPAAVRPSLLLSDDELANELRQMTDALTDRLFGGAVRGAAEVVFPVSRLVVDPERFEADEEESMAARGMGVVYERTSGGAQLRGVVDAAAREELLDRYYRPHHARLTSAVDAALAAHGRCLVVDAHSFPSVPLPYESDQRPDRPDLCVGTDAFHTPGALAEAVVEAGRALGWSVAVDRPFAGALVPAARYRRDARVSAVMIEINRRLYLDEETGAPSQAFDEVRGSIARLLAALTEVGGEAAS